MRKRYYCHNCDIEFVRPESTVPVCPECEGTNVTLEESVEPGVWRKIYSKIKPVFEYCCMPWKFFSNAELSSSGFYSIVFIHTLATVLSLRYFMTTGGQYQSLQELFWFGRTWLFHYPDFLVEPLVNGDASLVSISTLTVLVVLFAWEIIRINLFQLGLYIMGIVARFETISARFAGLIWIPNIVFGLVQVAVLTAVDRGIFWGEILMSEAISWLVFGIVVGLMVLFVLSFLSLVDVGYVNYPVGLVLIVLLQGTFGFILVFLSKGWLYPWNGLAVMLPADGSYLEATWRLVIGPLGSGTEFGELLNLVLTWST